MEFYFNNNELIDDDDLSHQAKFMKYEKNMFGFTSAGNIDQFYGIMSDGFSHEKRVIFSKMARCYVQPNFYGDTSTMEIIGHLFAVKFGVVNAKANSEVVLIHDDVYKQDFALELGTFGCGYDSLTSTFFPFFQIDAKLNNKSYEYFEFWLASTEGCNHYVHFYDSNFAEKNYDRLVPIHNLTSFSSSIWNHCISRFLLMSRNYQTPIIVDDDKMDMKSIFYEKGKFVFDKPILFRNKAYEVLQMNISLPFERKQSVNENLNNFVNQLPDREKSWTVKCINVSTQTQMKPEKTWKDLLKLHETVASKRKTVTYNQVSYCLAKLDGIKQSIEPPDYIKEIDWINHYYPEHERDSNNESYDYPRTQKVMLTSTRHAWMDMHLDYGAAAVWYHVFKGQKEFLLIEPINANIKLHIEHISKTGTKASKEANWFADKVSELHPETMYWVTVREGETIIFPAGFFHSVYTPLDSIIFLEVFSITKQYQFH